MSQRNKVFNRFVEIGRVCLINRGEDAGKLCVIVDVIDGTRALVDGPSSVNGVSRQPMNFKRLALTDIVIKVPVGARLKTLTKAYKAADVDAKWAKTSEGRKLAIRAARAKANDFDRFKLRHARKLRASVANAAVKK